MSKLRYLQGMLFLAAICITFPSCENEQWATFDPQYSYVKFSDEQLSIRENSDKVLNIVVGASGVSGQLLTVDFEIQAGDSTAGYRTAVEEVDYYILNESKTLHFEKGAGYDTIKIMPIDNTLKDLHSALQINLKSNNQGYTNGFNGKGASVQVVILDDESSSKFEGNWEVSGKTVWFYSPAGQLKASSDTANNNTLAFASYTVTIVAHPTLANTLQVKNFMNQPELTLTLTTNEVDSISMTAGMIGRIKTADIFFAGFDADGEDTGTLPVPGEIIDNNTLRFCRYMSYYYNNETIVYTGPSATVLKSTWKRID